MTCSISCTCAANSKSNYSYKTKGCWWKVLQINFKLFLLILADQDIVCLKQFIILIITSAAIVSIQVTKGKRVCPGFLEEKAKQVCLLIFALISGIIPNVFISKIDLLFMKKKNICSVPILFKVKTRKKGTFLFIGWWLSKPWDRGDGTFRPVMLWGISPHSARPRGKSRVASALGLVSMPDIPTAPQSDTGQQFARSKLALSERPCDYRTSVTMDTLSKYCRVSFPELPAGIESSCLGVSVYRGIVKTNSKNCFKFLI